MFFEKLHRNHTWQGKETKTLWQRMFCHMFNKIVTVISSFDKHNVQIRQRINM